MYRRARWITAVAVTGKCDVNTAMFGRNCDSLTMIMSDTKRSAVRRVVLERLLRQVSVWLFSGSSSGGIPGIRRPVRRLERTDSRDRNSTQRYTAWKSGNRFCTGPGLVARAFRYRLLVFGLSERTHRRILAQASAVADVRLVCSGRFVGAYRECHRIFMVEHRNPRRFVCSARPGRIADLRLLTLMLLGG